jgi:hypothetical protein
MKEVLTKSFWQSVRKTFYEALEDAPAKDQAPQVPAEGKEKVSSTVDGAARESSSES